MPDTPTSRTSERVLGGRYRLVRSIARGGMAEVWEGHDDVLARPVAVKILHAHLAGDDDFVERFRREAVAAARLTHPDIVATFDAGTDGTAAYIVMELVRGRTLRQALLQDGAFPADQVVRIGTRVADALDHAHRAGIVHRDVKPGNILLADDGSVKVADFGIAKLQDSGDLTQTGAVIGTAKYLSPEQVEGRSPDVRSDIYALGVVCYEMLCGRPPFSADTELATALAHVREVPSPPRAHHGGIPGPVEAAVLKAMARDPADRFQTAGDFSIALAGADLGAAPAEDSDEHTPPAGVVRVPRGKRRWAPALLVLALVMLVAAVVISQLPSVRTGRSGAPLSGPAARANRQIPILEAHSFDPQGDGEENEPRAQAAIDGNPATSWATVGYTTRQFGRLKQGVGLTLTLGSPQKLGRLTVVSPTQDWSAMVYVSAQSASDLTGWGAAVDRRTGINGTIDFDLHGRLGGYVLLWIIDPGVSRKTEISEITIQG